VEPSTQIITAKELFSQESIRKKFTEMLGKRAPQFITSVLQCVASNNLLKNADPNSIYNAAAVAATLDLPLNNQLGFAYIVPYNINTNVGTREEPKWESKVVAQFQIGWKGYVQLGQRTGQYKRIAATRILEHQLVSDDPLEGPTFDFTKKLGEGQAEKVVGYASYFRLITGFEKTVYMSMAKLHEHGKKFSKSYSSKSGLWQTDPETMCLKTVLKLNLSKYGPMSIELQTAYQTDQALIQDSDTLDVKYVDNDQEEPSKAHDRITLLIRDAKTIDDLEPLREHADLDQQMEIARKELTILKKLLSAAPAEAANSDMVLNLKARIKALEELTA
jgi:recombination protein RecT